MEATSVTCPRCQNTFPLTTAIERPILEKARAQLEKEREAIAAEARKSAIEEQTRQMQEMQAKLAAKDRKLAEAQQSELKLIKEKADFEEQKKAFELEVARRAELVKETVARQKDEEFRLRELEFAKKEDAWKRQVDEMKRKVEQGSQQTQGEVLELDLEARLARCFDEDEIVEVAKGANGADILQHVKSEIGQDCGAILWECKRTKAFSETWLRKLKDDQLSAKAEIGVIVTTALPKGLSTFECREGVWITSPALALPLAAALRHTLIEVTSARRSVEGMQGKMGVVYEYISGPQFKARVLAIVEGFKSMQEDLESEKRTTLKQWAKREKQLERVISNTVGMHGDLAGIIGKSLPAIEQMELLEDADDPHFRYPALQQD